MSTDIWKGILLCIQHIKQSFADGFGKTGYKNQHWRLQIHYFGGRGEGQVDNWLLLGTIAIWVYGGIRKWKARGSGLKC